MFRWIKFLAIQRFWSYYYGRWRNVTKTPAVSVQVCLTRSAGAKIGGSLAEIGEVVYSVGSLGEIFLDFANGEYGKAGKEGFCVLGWKLVGMGLNKVLSGYGKKIGEEGFDLGTEVIRQGVNLKLSGVEQLIDKIIEKKENMGSKQNEN